MESGEKRNKMCQWTRRCHGLRRETAIISKEKASTNQGDIGLPQRKGGVSKKTVFLRPEKQEGREAES